MLIKQHEFVKIELNKWKVYEIHTKASKNSDCLLYHLCGGLCSAVNIRRVNYKFEDYLPDDAKSTHALDVM